MSAPVYLLVIGNGYSEAWYRLSKSERDALWARVQDVDRRAGMELVVACDSRWADEDVKMWAVLKYPDMDAYQEKVRELEAMEWWRYFSARTILGTEMEQQAE